MSRDCPWCRDCGNCDHGLDASGPCTCGPCTCTEPCAHPLCGRDERVAAVPAPRAVGSSHDEAAELVRQYRRWRDASWKDRTDPVLGPGIYLDIYEWAAKTVDLLSEFAGEGDVT